MLKRQALSANVMLFESLELPEESAVWLRSLAVGQGETLGFTT